MQNLNTNFGNILTEEEEEEIVTPSVYEMFGTPLQESTAEPTQQAVAIEEEQEPKSVYEMFGSEAPPVPTMTERMRGADLFEPGSYAGRMGEQSIQRVSEKRKAKGDLIRSYGDIPFDEAKSFDDHILTFDIARNDSFQAKQKKFKEKYPQGDIMQVTYPVEFPEADPGLVVQYTQTQTPEARYMARPDVSTASGVRGATSQIQGARASYLARAQPIEPTQFRSALVARKNPDEPYRELSPVTGFASGLLSEESLSSAALGIPYGPVGTAIGFFGGLMAKSTIEQYRGYEYLEGIDAADVTNALAEGAAVGLFDMATRRALRGLGYSAKQVDVIDAMESFSRLQQREAALGLAGGLEPITIGQAGGTLTRATYRQAALLGGTQAEIVMSNTERSMFRFLTANANDIPYEALSDQALADVLQVQQQGILSLKRPAGPRNRYNMGMTIRDGLKSFQKASDIKFSREYASLLDMANELGVDLSFSLAAPLSRGADLPPISIKELARRNQTGTTGRAAPEVIEETGSDVITNLEGEVSTQLNKIYDNILSLDDNLISGPDISTSFEQLKAIRTSLFAIKENANIPSWQQAQAKEMWSLLTQLMENPNTVAGRAEDLASFTGFWRQVSEDYKQVEDFMSLGYVKTAVNDFGVIPEALARKYASPGRGSELQTIKNTLKKEEWEQFRQYAYNDFADLGNSVTADDLALQLGSKEAAEAAIAEGNQTLNTARWSLNRLNNYARSDQLGLRLIMTKAEENELRKFLVDTIKLESSPWAMARETIMDEADRALQILNDSKPSEIRAFIEAAGGMDSRQGYALRAAVYQDILNNSTRASRHYNNVVDLELVRNNIEKWRRSGKLKEIFSDKDWQQIGDVQYYSHVVSGVSDVGGGIQRGEVVAAMTQAPTEILSGNYGKVARTVFKPILSARALSAILAAPAVRATYNVIKPTTENFISNFGAISINAYNDAMRYYGEDIYQPEFERQINRMGGAAQPAP